MRIKWSDYLVTAFVRFICGAIIGVVAGVVLAFLGSSLRRHRVGKAHSPLVDLIQKGDYRTLFMWFGAAALVGALIAVITIPRWQTPWYKGHDKDDGAA